MIREPEYRGERWVLHVADCLEVMRGMEPGGINAIVTDPPFGMNWDTNPQRFTAGKGGQGIQGSRPVLNDDKPFDPSPWLDFPKVILWGANHYAQRLPVGTTLVWVKKPEQMHGTFLSDGEIGWQKGGHGVYVYTHIWNGVARMSENGQHFHPTQKPVALMSWLIARLNLPKNATIFDPYGGSFSTGVAALRMGYRFIGCDLDRKYVEIGAKRLTDEESQIPLDFNGDEPLSVTKQFPTPKDAPNLQTGMDF